MNNFLHTPAYMLDELNFWSLETDVLFDFKYYFVTHNPK